MTGLPTLTLWPHLAVLAARGIKTVETRTGPPAGDMRPPGVTPIPGFAINRGDRIGLHAAAEIPPDVLAAGAGDYTIERDNPPGTTPAYLLRGPGLAWPYRLPVGVMIGTAVVADTVPVDSITWVPAGGIAGARHWGLGDRCAVVVESERPLGEYDPGRWALLLTDHAPTTRRCPWCWGTGFLVGDPPVSAVVPCSTCGGPGKSTGLCPPVPARGRQGVWRWTPEVTSG